MKLALTLLCLLLVFLYKSLAAEDIWETLTDEQLIELTSGRHDDTLAKMMKSFEKDETKTNKQHYKSSELASAPNDKNETNEANETAQPLDDYYYKSLESMAINDAAIDSFFANNVVVRVKREDSDNESYDHSEPIQMADSDIDMHLGQMIKHAIHVEQQLNETKASGNLKHHHHHDKKRTDEPSAEEEIVDKMTISDEEALPDEEHSMQLMETDESKNEIMLEGEETADEEVNDKKETMLESEDTADDEADDKKEKEDAHQQPLDEYISYDDYYGTGLTEDDAAIKMDISSAIDEMPPVAINLSPSNVYDANVPMPDEADSSEGDGDAEKKAKRHLPTDGYYYEYDGSFEHEFLRQGQMSDDGLNHRFRNEKLGRGMEQKIYDASVDSADVAQTIRRQRKMLGGWQHDFHGTDMNAMLRKTELKVVPFKMPFSIEDEQSENTLPTELVTHQQLLTKDDAEHLVVKKQRTEDLTSLTEEYHNYDEAISQSETAEKRDEMNSAERPLTDTAKKPTVRDATIVDEVAVPDKAIDDLLHNYLPNAKLVGQVEVPKDQVKNLLRDRKFAFSQGKGSEVKTDAHHLVDNTATKAKKPVSGSASVQSNGIDKEKLKGLSFKEIVEFLKKHQAKQQANGISNNDKKPVERTLGNRQFDRRHPLGDSQKRQAVEGAVLVNEVAAHKAAHDGSSFELASVEVQLKPAKKHDDKLLRPIRRQSWNATRSFRGNSRWTRRDVSNIPNLPVTDDADQYCKAIKQAVPDCEYYLFQDPTFCGAFFFCIFADTVEDTRGIRALCSRDYRFSPSMMTCVKSWNPNSVCDPDPCEDPYSAASISGCWVDPNNCRKFYQCSTAMSVPNCCPYGLHVNETCGCVNGPSPCRAACDSDEPGPKPAKPIVHPDNTCLDSALNLLRPRPGTNDCDIFDPATDSWVLIECDEGTAFQLNTCSCSAFVQRDPSSPAKTYRQCSLYLTFNNDIEDFSTNEFWTRSTGSVSISKNIYAAGSGSALFRNGEVIIEGFNNMDMGKQASWCLMYRCSPDANDVSQTSCANVRASLLSNVNPKSGKYSINMAIDGARTASIRVMGPPLYHTVNSTGSLDSGNDGWHQLCCIYDGSSMGIFEDGSLIQTAGSSPIQKNLQSIPAPYVVSKNSEFNGFIDEVLVCKTTLSPNEMEAHRRGHRAYLEDAGLIPPCPAHRPNC